jgi:hypothetical protein
LNIANRVADGGDEAAAAVDEADNSSPDVTESTP